MIFRELNLAGAFVIEPQLIEDKRGFFARTWCEREFGEHDLNSNLVQCNISYNQHQNTVRGMHYQAAPYGETKLVRCTAGKIYDVIIDLRPDSPTFKQWVGVELSSANRLALYIPEGFAHGFQTLEANSEVFYQMSNFFEPNYARGVRWNDPAFHIEWPAIEGKLVISERDEAYGDFLE